MASGSGVSGVSGTAVAATAAGALLVWSGVKGTSLTGTLRAVLSGQSPPTQKVNAVSGNVADLTTSTPAPESGTAAQGVNETTPGSGTDAANETLGKLMAGGYGWATGANWTALNNGWGTLESGWNATAQNPSSGAFGIAQALGHGTAATQGTAVINGITHNEYGPMNMNISDATCQAANNGSAVAQIAWGLLYIKDTYGSPSQVPGWQGGSYGGY